MQEEKWDEQAHTA
jgi:hypothetical protein